jgi:cell division protein FtsI (penicillin-binding protein 3)
MLRPSRLALLHALLLLFAIALIGRAGQVQLWQRGTWAARADAQHYKQVELPAPRGGIFDEHGVPLARTRAAVRLSVAPRELRRDSLHVVANAMVRLGIPADAAQHALDTSRAWVTLPGVYSPVAAQRLAAQRGVYAEPLLERVYTQREATRRVVGFVGPDGAPVDGLELALDSVLRGSAGRALLEREARGGRFAVAGDTLVEPREGDVVVLTINQELQEIAQRALDSAVAASGADGGDLVVLDPEDGEIRAMASRRTDPRSAGSPVLSEPFEPGSTLKPLLAASLLAAGRAQPDERVNTERGTWTVAGRTITDEHPAPSLTLREVIRWSSNIGIVKFSSRLTPREQFGALRDFGFGTATGVPFPSEAAGTLREPALWSKQSPASLAMGYEVAVTPLQLAAAYVPIANGGELLEPALVKEIRSADGTVRYRHARRVVRRVVDTASASTVRAMMVDVVAMGTSTEAAMRGFTIAGKTGTSRRAAAGSHGAYAAGHYTASFVALFPAEHPQYVLLVKLDDPRGQYFGGKTAAPVSKIVLEAALAARDASLDRGSLASRESLVPAGAAAIDHRPSAIVAATTPESNAVTLAAGRWPLADSSVAFTVPSALSPRAAPSARAVPSVRGLSLRAAVLALHRAGFNVAVGSIGSSATGTVPAAGAVARQGAVVRLETMP